MASGAVIAAREPSAPPSWWMKDSSRAAYVGVAWVCSVAGADGPIALDDERLDGSATQLRIEDLQAEARYARERRGLLPGKDVRPAAHNHHSPSRNSNGCTKGPRRASVEAPQQHSPRSRR